MKLKRKLIAVVATIIFVFVAIIAIKIMFSIDYNEDSLKMVKIRTEKTDSGVKCTFKEFKGAKSVYTLNMDKGDLINIRFKSDGIKLAIVDKDDKALEKIDGQDQTELEFKSKKEGSYLIVVYGKKKNGSFEIGVMSKEGEEEIVNSSF